MTAVASVTQVVAALSRLRIPYMVVGSFSSNVYGRPRSTKDADFVIELGNQTISQLASEIGSDFILDPQMSFESITSTMRFQLTHRDTAFMIELFQLSTDPHDIARFSRRISGPIGNGQTAFIPTAEDVIVTKLRWSKQGRRPKDVQDVQDVLKIQLGRLDLAYIRQWTDQHGTRELFESLLARGAGAGMTRPDPGHQGVDVTVFREFLRRMQRRHIIQSWAGVVGGACLALLGPMCVLLFYTMISMSLIAGYGFWRSYSIVAGVILPLAFLIAWRLRGSVLERWMPDADTISSRMVRRVVAPALILLEIANIGPRLVIWGTERLLHQQRFTGTSLPRAADAIALLFKADSGISPAAMLKPGEPADLLTPLLAFLMNHQLIDISKQGDRVWLTSQARTDLQKLRSEH